jgi:hypothetical protein
MTLEAEVVALLEQLKAVHVMAIAAAHIIAVHLALHERSVDVNLLENLTVRVVQTIAQHRRELTFHQFATAVVVVAEF